MLSTSHLNPMFARGEQRRWKSLRLVEWHLGAKESGYVFCIPPNQEFESSIPSLLVWLRVYLYPFFFWLPDQDDPRLLLAALVHDALLESGWRHTSAAGEWHDAALKGGYRKWKAGIMALFVFAWGLRKYKATQIEKLV